VETHPLYFKTTPTCSCWNLDVLLGSLENFVNVFQNGFPGGTRWVGESYLGNVTSWVVEKRDNYLIAHHGYRLEEDKQQQFSFVSYGSLPRDGNVLRPESLGNSQTDLHMPVYISWWGHLHEQDVYTTPEDVKGNTEEPEVGCQVVLGIWSTHHL
jgi:hypothetical protein